MNSLGAETLFSRFLAGLGSETIHVAAGLSSDFEIGTTAVSHFASHSHHPWPDVTEDAVRQAWNDASTRLDLKWRHIFGNVIPEAQRHIAGHLDLDHPERLIFSPNTHEMLVRLFSCFANKRSESDPVRILTTDAEYHSAMWQFSRWNELPYVTVTPIPVEPFHTFEERFKAEAGKNKWDMVYLSHVFFNSGLMVSDLEDIVDAFTDPETMIIIDGYHGFMAKPTSLKKIQGRAFYLAGGYKYAMAGEGACFLYAPTHCPWNPYDIGWFALFPYLQAGLPFGQSINFGNQANKFWGATFDPTGLYRLNAVMRLFAEKGMTVTKMDQYVMGLQNYFLEELAREPIPWLTDLITPRDLFRAGHFLTYRLPNAPKREEQLLQKGIIVDSRSNSMRFGFGIYQDRLMIDRMLERARSIPVGV